MVRSAETVSGDLKAELEEYLESPDPEAALIIVARGIGRIQKIAKLATAVGERVEVKSPPEWDGKGWQRLVGEEFRRLERQAASDAITALLGHAGNEPVVIASKVAQVVAATPAGQTVTAADVEKVVEGHGRATGFQVADAIGDRDAAGALVALRGALESGEAPLALLGAIVFRFRQLLQIRAGANARDVGTSPANHRRMAAVVAAFSPGELAWCHDRLARLDVELKGSELSPEMALELAIIEVASSQQVGRPWNPLAAG